jgi:hypothetical protein
MTLCQVCSFARMGRPGMHGQTDLPAVAEGTEGGEWRHIREANLLRQGCRKLVVGHAVNDAGEPVLRRFDE